MNSRYASGPILAWFCLIGCGESASSGASEPFRVYRDVKDRPLAQFFAGELPGIASDPSGTPGTTAGDANRTTTSADTSILPKLTSYSVPNQVVVPGQHYSKVSGRLSTNSSAVALALDAGRGYWVLPAGIVDTSSNDELMWQALCDYSPELEPGYHFLTAAPIDTAGVFGVQTQKKLCIAGRTSDSLAVCEPSLPLPETVISLSWDTNVDLDLQVMTPDGLLVTPKHPNTLALSDNAAVPVEAGQIDRDSNAGCAIDGIRYENLVFATIKPQSGNWGVYVDLFDSCKQSVVHFTVRAYQAVTDAAGNRTLQEMSKVVGILLATDATGGSKSLGTFVVEYHF